MALSTSHEGKSLCVYHPSALQIATLCDGKSRIFIRMRKRTRIRAFRSVPYISVNFVIRIRAYGFLAIPSLKLGLHMHVYVSRAVNFQIDLRGGQWKTI